MDKMSLQEFAELTEDVALALNKKRPPGYVKSIFGHIQDTFDKKEIIDGGVRLARTATFLPSVKEWIDSIKEAKRMSEQKEAGWGSNHQPVKRNADFELNVRRVKKWLDEGMSAEEAYRRRVAEIQAERQPQC